MKAISIVLALVFLTATVAAAHPASGIIVSKSGDVFFQDIVGKAIWKIDAAGKLTKYYDKMGGHWMALDANGAFSRSEPKPVERITQAGEKPTIIMAEGGAPIAVCGDGNLYYGLALFDSDRVAVGVTRISPKGDRSILSPKLNETLDSYQGLTGLAPGPNGTLYIACPTAIVKVKVDGTFTTIVHPIRVKDGDEYPADNNPSPYLRGIAVDDAGVIYAAAAGERCVIKVTEDGKVETILKSERPWSPTGVAVHNGSVYVLEYTNANGGAAEGWTPRVRRLAPDGKISVLAMIDSPK
jgi:sugar lactone lactonase YvrE